MLLESVAAVVSWAGIVFLDLFEAFETFFTLLDEKMSSMENKQHGHNVEKKKRKKEQNNKDRK